MDIHSNVEYTFHVVLLLLHAVIPAVLCVN